MSSRLWYRAELRDDVIAADHVSTIREQFTEALGAAGWPDGACLFLVTAHTRRGRARKGDEQAEAVFFSPAAIAAMPRHTSLPPAAQSRVRRLTGPARRCSWATTATGISCRARHTDEAPWRGPYSITTSVTHTNATTIAANAIRVRRCVIRSAAAPFDVHAIQRAACASGVSSASAATGVAICRVVMRHHF
jgi:hypothetical protein